MAQAPAVGARLHHRGRATRLPPPSRAACARSAEPLICFNPLQKWKVGFDGNLDVYDMRYTLTHEIGHAIGLDHPGAAGALMGFRYDEKLKGLAQERYRGGAKIVWAAEAVVREVALLWAKAPELEYTRIGKCALWGASGPCRQTQRKSCS